MKKGDFYINTINGKNVGYPKVSGWIEEIQDSKGNVLMIGYDKEKGEWRATEITTGFKCNVQFHKTKASCMEEVHNIIDDISFVLERNLKADMGGYIKSFKDFINANGGM